MGLDVHSMCAECGGKCCRYFCFQIDAPDTFEEFDDIRWFLLHENISVHIEEGDWYISIANKCNALVPDGQSTKCSIYEDRPVICRGYSRDNCDHTGGDYEYDEQFDTPEDLEKYAKKVLGKKAYKKAKEKAYKKMAKKEAKSEKRKRKQAEAGG